MYMCSAVAAPMYIERVYLISAVRRWNSPEEKMMRGHVMAVNAKAREARKAKGISEPARFVAPNHVAK